MDGATGWSQQARVMIAPIRRKAAPVRPAVPAVLRLAQRSDAGASNGATAASSSSSSLTVSAVQVCPCTRVHVSHIPVPPV